MEVVRGKKNFTSVDKRFETIGFPGNVRLFDPTICGDDFERKDPASGQNSTLIGVWNFQNHIKRYADLFAKSNLLSLHVARAVGEYKATRSAQSLGARQNYSYLYSMQYKGWHHHFFRDESSETILSLAVASQFQSDESFLCIDGEKVLAHICEGNRPGEKTEAYTGLSLEALLPHIENHIPLSLSTGSFQIVEVIGEGFESVVFKVRNQVSGAFAALKLGKLILEDNFRVLQPTLTTIQERGFEIPQYVSYEAHYNGILMQYYEGESFASYIEQMEQKQRPLIEVLRTYATCLNKLISLKALYLSHGDAHEGNWLIGDTPTLIDFRYSQSLAFTSSIYASRDVFAMLCILYRLVYKGHPANRQEVKQALMQQKTYRFEHPNAFPQFHHENRYDEWLKQFLCCSVYNPQDYTLQDIIHAVNIYLRGFNIP